MKFLLLELQYYLFMIQDFGEDVSSEFCDQSFPEKQPRADFVFRNALGDTCKLYNKLITHLSVQHVNCVIVN